MADIIATLFKFRQFLFEYGPFFLAAWLGLAVTTGLIRVAQRKGFDRKAPSNSFLNYRPWHWILRLLFFQLWLPAGKRPTLSVFSGTLFFSLAASVPSLVVTSLIGWEAVWLRLGLTALFALSIHWFVTAALPQKPEKAGELQQDVALAIPTVSLGSLRSLAQATGKSFIGQVEGAVIPLIIGFSLASVLTIYVPAYAVRPWLGEGAWQGPYLAALLAMPFQLTGGGEVLLASALLVKGASLGTALSVMLVAPSTTFFVIRNLSQPLKGRLIAQYLIVSWFVAGSLGVTVDAIRRLLGG